MVTANTARCVMIEDIDDLVAAAFVAREWHGGQFTALYKLGCGEWHELQSQDIHDALSELSKCDASTALDPHHGVTDLGVALDGLRLWCDRHPLIDS